MPTVILEKLQDPTPNEYLQAINKYVHCSKVSLYLEQAPWAIKILLVSTKHMQMIKTLNGFNKYIYMYEV